MTNCLRTVDKPATDMGESGMSKWLLEMGRDQFQSVKADDCRINSGCAVFLRWRADDLVVSEAYPAGSWLSISLDEDDE
jgi:hypothetical protein